MLLPQAERADGFTGDTRSTSEPPPSCDDKVTDPSSGLLNHHSTTNTRYAPFSAGRHRTRTRPAVERTSSPHTRCGSQPDLAAAQCPALPRLTRAYTKAADTPVSAPSSDASYLPFENHPLGIGISVLPMIARRRVAGRSGTGSSPGPAWRPAADAKPMTEV